MTSCDTCDNVCRDLKTEVIVYRLSEWV
jgi:hypothetical protein